MAGRLRGRNELFGVDDAIIGGILSCPPIGNEMKRREQMISVGDATLKESEGSESEAYYKCLQAGVEGECATRSGIRALAARRYRRWLARRRCCWAPREKWRPVLRARNAVSHGALMPASKLLRGMKGENR